MQRDLYQYGEPSAGTVLPLLSSALRRTWLAAAGSQLTTTDYLTSGGLWSSLNVAAEAVHDTLDPEQHALERRLFLSLVSVEDGHPLRRRISLDQLGADLHPVAGAFVAARLLTVDDGEVEISHDALLAQWERLKGWIEEEGASLLIERRIHIASRLWDEGGRQPETLLPAEAELWRSWAAGDDAPLLSTLERSFIDESLRHAEAVAADQRRTIHRLRVRQWVAVGAFVVAVAMALSAFLFGARSERFRVQAEAATHSAQARQIALVADEVRPVTPNVAAQLSVAALSLDDSVETRSAVVQSAGSEVPTRATGPAGNTNVAASADGRTIVRADSAGEVSIWRDGGIAAAPSTRFASGGRQLFTLTLAEIDSRLLAFVGGQQTGGLWDITDEPRSLGDFGADTVVYSSTFAGHTLLFGTLEGEIRRYDLTTPTTPSELPTLSVGAGTQVHPLGTADDAWPATCAFNQDETLFAAMSKDGQGLSVYRIDGGLEHLVTHPMINDEIPSKITFSSVGTLAVGNTPGDITLYDMSDPARPSATQQLRDARSSISQLDFAADGSTLFAATEEGLVWAWARGADGRFALDLRLKTRSTSVPGVAALGDDVLMTLADGRTVAWPRHPRREGERLCERFGTPLSATEWERLVPGVAQTDGCG